MTRLLARMAQDFRSCWGRLFATDLLYKLVAFVLLTPLLALLIRILLALAGRTLLADLDILLFLVTPFGWFYLITVGALWLTIAALEMAALLTILADADSLRSVSMRSALQYAATHAIPVLRVTAQMIGYVLLILAPFLVLAAIVYHGLLTDYDINYYLKEKPPVFQFSLAIGGLLVAGLTIVLLRLISGWFFALPLVLFENVPASKALAASRERAAGHRKRILQWLIGWLVMTSSIAILLSSIVVALGRIVVPTATRSLSLLVPTIGLMLCLWFISGLLTNLVSSTTFATMLMRLYRELACKIDWQTAQQQASTIASRPKGIRFGWFPVLAAGGFAVAIASGIGFWAVQSIRLEDQVAIIAHRGASASAPENTLASIELAIQEGADWVEIDVQETADGQVVVMHDSDFMKLAGRDLKIWNATVGDLQGIDIGSWFDPKFSDQRTPTLEQVLRLCKDRIKVDIELKYYGHDQKLEQRVIDVVESQDMSAEVMYMSLKLNRVRKMKSLRPKCTAGLLMSVSTGDLKQIEADFLAVNARFATRQSIRAAHAIGKQVFVWTVNDPVLMSSMISRGVDGVITDRPALVRKVLQERKELGVVARSLVELSGLFGVPLPVAGQ